MCGFAGVLGRSPASDLDLQRLAEVLRHRGPDSSGVWRDSAAGIGLAHTRLSIIDVSPAGHQPMISPSGRYVMVLNGEIYNHRDLRERVSGALRETSGEPRWIGHSDTETLLGCFDRWGIRASVEMTVGMFAFAVWDRQLDVLTLARDRLGEKPLYYGWQRGTFLFGSELKALRRHASFVGEIDRDALASFMRYGYVPAPRSIYRGIQKLPAGTLLSVGVGETAATPTPYWSFWDVAQAGVRAPIQASENEVVQELERVLGDAVDLQQVADVPVGAFLSGGIDSSLVVALMQERSQRRVHTFTIGFEDRHYDEAASARAVARHLGTIHTEAYATPKEAQDVIPRLPSLYDEPFSDSSQIPTFLVSQLARTGVTVSLSGDGGDELFGGYTRYRWARRILRFPRMLRLLFAGLLTRLTPQQWSQLMEGVGSVLPRARQIRMPGDKAHKLAAVMGVSSDAAIYERLVSTWPEPDALVVNGHDASDLPGDWARAVELGATEHRMMALDTRTYLADDILCKVDRAAMGVSLETRAPFLDHRVVEFAWRLPIERKIRDGQGKWILRRVLAKRIPAGLLDRPKMGFGVPIDAWLRGPLKEWADGLLSEERIQREGYLRPGPIRQMWQEHLKGTRNWQYRLWTALMFQAWLESVS